MVWAPPITQVILVSLLCERCSSALRNGYRSGTWEHPSPRGMKFILQ